ncbi:33676_t:CDS:1, partial [Gigaspora margarita]
INFSLLILRDLICQIPDSFKIIESCSNENINKRHYSIQPTLLKVMAKTHLYYVLLAVKI